MFYSSIATLYDIFFATCAPMNVRLFPVVVLIRLSHVTTTNIWMCVCAILSQIKLSALMIVQVTVLYRNLNKCQYRQEPLKKYLVNYFKRLENGVSSRGVEPRRSHCLE